ncbi:SRPBCC family protein [Natrialba asiatica]|uniref:Activator of Hsp90 ATPase 1 family protein n=1 Tax=Natrialba asiatica (strain ATCC 700177 / DSM 12278 / JCM 9576 / FERM P-10747 / NBRC 102637 / 172P1) TaxID=29540 RepID=M0AWL7_NATA1|nr:SRPBCC domain-containing protein [Natrialba asiatica]ELZ02368.1 activator of Hsp90 ATPase 1 family protein [Natrialba asiatica DSM 12278]
MADEKTTATEFEPSVYDTTIRRTFDAPRERVFEAWTDPERVEQWWGPAEFTVPYCELDVRPDGEFRIDMQGPDGTIYPDTGVYHVVDEPERLEVTSRALEDEDGIPQLEVYQTVTFAERGEQTELTIRAEVIRASEAVADSLEGMEQGWSQSLDKLEGFIADGSAVPSTSD